MSRVRGEAVKDRVVLHESKVKFVDIRIGRVLVSAREPEGVGWAPGDGTYKYWVKGGISLLYLHFGLIVN